MTASTQSPLFAYRSGDALGFAAGLPEKALVHQFQANVVNPKLARFSANGKLFGWICSMGVVVVDVDTRKVLRDLEIKAPLDYSFSPSGLYISTFERLIKQADESQPLHRNVKVWNTLTGEIVTSFTHKNQESWMIQWTEDELFFARLVRNEVQIYSLATDTSQPHSRLILEGIAEFSLSPGRNPSVAVFVPEKKGAPAIVRLYGLNSFNYPLSNKTFYKADRIQFKWNTIGTNVLVLTQTETDKTGQSYYGETNLYYLSAVGNYDCRVMLDAEGPIHDIAWGPNSSEFIVVYGNMPAKAALFDSRANKIFDFGSSPKNYVRYSPFGRLVLLAGFGNLAGYVEIWDRKQLRMLSRFQEPAAVYCEFLPNATHILSATLSPRLRVDNRWRIRSYTGDILWEQNFKELFQVVQCPAHAGHRGLNRDQLEAAEMGLPLTEGKKDTSGGSGVSRLEEGGKTAGAYVPPHLRAKMNNTASTVQPMTYKESPNRHGLVKDTANQKQQQQQKQQPQQQQQQPKPVKPQEVAVNGQLAEVEKQILGVQRKLRAIEGLKQKLKEGKPLEKNQLDKLANESKLEDELHGLESKRSALQSVVS